MRRTKALNDSRLERSKSITNKVLEVAVIGTGNMGFHHIQAIRAHNLAKIIAVADPLVNPKKIKEILGADVAIFHEANELLKNVKPDVVHICTPPSNHAGLARLSLNQGANVYVEKPFALSVSEAQEVIDLAKSSGLRVCAGHQLLFESPTKKIMGLLKQIGDIIHFESYFSFSQVRRNASPVEQLLDILPHPICLFVAFMQECLSNITTKCFNLRSLEVRPHGNVHALIRAGAATGVLVVTLRGRPVESYVRIVGTKGALHADLVIGTVKNFIGPGSSKASLVFNRYIEAKQILFTTTQALLERLLKKQKSYRGLPELIRIFYQSIVNNTHQPLTAFSILETVRLCEIVGKKLRKEESKHERRAEAELRKEERKLPPPGKKKGWVLVTGGTGFLGRRIVSELRSNGFRVRVVSRCMPPASQRVAGVQYHEADLSDGVSDQLMKEVLIIIHAAAATAGDKEGHRRNTVSTTRNILRAAAQRGVRKFIHISSIAVLKSSPGLDEPLDEDTPINLDESRGPYVWGKAQSERLAVQLGDELGIMVRIIRPGPLMNYDAYEPPGRLGKEIGNIFVAVGRRDQKLSVCDIKTATAVIRSYVEDFESKPHILNLVNPSSPTRGEHVKLLLNKRTDLRCIWVPEAFLSFLGPLFVPLQKIFRPGAKPIDVRSVFSSPNYRTDSAQKIIQEAYE